MQTTWRLFDSEIGLNRPLFLIAGPCVIESEQLAIDTAGYLKEITQKLGLTFIYKSSYDKANRSSDSTFRGLGIDEGLHVESFDGGQAGAVHGTGSAARPSASSMRWGCGSSARSKIGRAHV